MASLVGPIEPGGASGTPAAEAIAIAELEARPVRVEYAPIPTLLAIADAVGGRPDGVPRHWVEAARSALASRDLRALLPLIARPHGFVPDCLLGLSDAGADPLPALRRIAATQGDHLLAALDAGGVAHARGPWAAVADDPEGWIDAYARSLHRIWKAVEGELTDAGVLVDRETERVGALLARGRLRQVLGEICPADSLGERELSLPATRKRRLRVTKRGLVLVPKLAGRHPALLRAYDGEALTHLAYPLPGAIRALGEHRPPMTTLEALVGAQRTRVLRRLDHPQPIGSLAETLVGVPATATHHVNSLEAAGLVARERRGRHVVVHRTARGSALLALYETG